MTRADLYRNATRRRVVAAARVSLGGGGGITRELLDDLAAQVGVHPNTVRVLFPSEDELLDAINDELLNECAVRLHAGVGRLSDGAIGFPTAAIALAESWPLDRGGMVIRAERRLRALRTHGDGSRAAAAERRFVGMLTEVLSDLVSKLGREFRPHAALAVRIILDTYERSFEAWLLDGHAESEFPASPYVQRTLPSLLEQLSNPTMTSGGTGGI